MLRILLISLLLSGCSLIKEQPPVEKLIYVTNPLTLPARPILPTWKGYEMECLTEDVKQKIRNRDLMRRQYAEELETIIKSTQTK
jgi:hypothetical protein